MSTDASRRSIESEPITYLIDGNNLAHHLYEMLPGGDVGPDADRWLIDRLASWVGQCRTRHLDVELYLDHARGALPAAPGVQVFAAEPPLQADDCILKHAKRHRDQGERCLVVTSDGELATAVRMLGLRVLTMDEFVIAQTLAEPVFAAPSDPGPYAPSQVRGRSQPEQDMEVRARWRHLFDEASASPRPKPRRTRRVRQIHQTGEPALFNSSPEPATSRDRVDQLQPDAASAPLAAEPSYRLSFGSWPARAGLEFMLGSACEAHRPQIATLLLSSSDTVWRDEDWQTLAEFLIDLCGQEPDFVGRGSLMDRVRRILLLAYPQPLPLSLIAERAGGKVSALRDKLKQASGKWVEPC